MLFACNLIVFVCRLNANGAKLNNVVHYLSNITVGGILRLGTQLVYEHTCHYYLYVHV